MQKGNLMSGLKRKGDLTVEMELTSEEIKVDFN